MATAAFERFACGDAGVGGVAKDAMRQAAHIRHEAGALKTMAVDALEDGVAEAAHRIRREPFRFVGIAFAIGVPVGLALAWGFGAITRPARRAA